MKTSDESKLQAVVDAIAEQDEIQVHAIQKRNDLYSYLKDICDHPRFITKDQHSPGSYYDREEWITYKHCSYCGENFGIVKKTVGGYG